MGGEPGESCGLIRKRKALECQALPDEWSAGDLEVAELALDVFKDAIVRGRGRAENRSA